jgi:hypothetical protein
MTQFVIPAKAGRRLDSARIQFMFAGFGSPLFPKGRLRRAGMTPQWTFHTVSMPSAQGAENAKSIVVLYTHNFSVCLASRGG